MPQTHTRKPCRGCGGQKPAGRNAYCSDKCAREGVKRSAQRYYAKNRLELREKQAAYTRPGSTERTRVRRAGEPEKYKARTALSNAIRCGDVARQPCEKCGTDEHVHGHHDDYSQPLDVRWLCALHHKEVHTSCP